MRLKRRREVLGLGGGAILAAAALGLPVSEARQQQWVILPCPGCDLPVAFLPDQKRNRCANCQTAVIRGLV